MQLLGVTSLLLAGLFSLSLGAEIGYRYPYRGYPQRNSFAEAGETTVFSDCCEARDSTSPALSGRYDITNVCLETEPPKQLARCDMETDGGGWLVIQRRIKTGGVDFDRSWKDYEDGFGDLQNLQDEFWYGLKNIYCLTSREDVEMRIDLIDEDNNEFYWVYQTFRLDGPQDNYRLHIGGAEGTPGTSDSMMYSNEMDFTTIDNDNDEWRFNCAWWCKGGWWHSRCTYANLNGVHDRNSFSGLIWYNDITKNFVYITSVEMKVRPKSCSQSLP